jgi:hypothetical protein
MADSAQDAAAGYIDAVKWIVGISSALLAGAFLHPELTVGWSLWGKVALVGVLLLLGASIVGGVVYLLWLNRIRRRKERIAEIDKELLAPVVIPDVQRANELREEKCQLMKEENASKGTQTFWYWAFILTFLFGGAIGIITFCAQVVYGQKPKDDCKKDCRDKCCDDQGAATTPDSRRFTVVQSAVHKTAHGMQEHTFLLDQQTGEIWQMICDQKGAVVAFQRVRRLDLNGNRENVEEAKKP